MGRLLKTLPLALVIFAGGWLLWHRDQISSFSDATALAKSQLGIQSGGLSNPFRQAGTSRFLQQPAYRKSGFGSAAPVRDYSGIPVRSTGSTTAASPYRRNDPLSASATISIASFKIDSTQAAGNMELTADICGQFDVIAIQNTTKLSIARLVNELNSRGHDFRFVNQQGPDNRFATLFNQRTVMLEEQHWYAVNDPNDLFLYEPLVAWFRTCNVPEEQAFTFTLANVQLNPKRPDQEIAYLGELFRAIRMDGRGEDDIILAGDFCSSDIQLDQVQAINGLVAAIVDTATNTRNDSQLDNIIFDEKATVEYAGLSGAFDFMKRYNMTLSEAMEVSRRLPVWAEFSALEGQSPGRAASFYEGFNASR